MIIFFAIIIILFLIAVSMYNRLIGRRNEVDNSFASIDVMLKKRYDLIPNLVETVKVYMGFEKNLLTDITELRARALTPGLKDNERMDIENQMTKLMSGLKVAVENYPDLKTSQNFMQLQATWNELEEQISAARRAYNAAVTDYNNAVQMFPSNIVANLMGFTARNFFDIPDMERENVNAKELFAN